MALLVLLAAGMFMYLCLPSARCIRCSLNGWVCFTGPDRQISVSENGGLASPGDVLEKEKLWGIPYINTGKTNGMF